MESWVLDKIRRAKAERWRFLDLGNAGLTELPPELFELDDLVGLNLSRELTDFQTGTWKETENAGRPNAISTLPFGLSRLSSLETLIAWRQPLSDVRPLARLTNLTSLNLSFTLVRDIEPLKVLTKLASLNLRFTNVSDVNPLNLLTDLTSLNLSSTQVSNVEPLKLLANLTSLNFSSTQFNDVKPLAQLINLTSLSLRFTQVSDVQPLAQLTNLTRCPSAIAACGRFRNLCCGYRNFRSYTYPETQSVIAPPKLSVAIMRTA